MLYLRISIPWALYYIYLYVYYLHLFFVSEIKMSGEPFPEIKSKDSLVAKYVTKPIWEKLSGVVTKVGLNHKVLLFCPRRFF